MTLADRISNLLEAHPAGLTVSVIALALGVRRQTVAEAVDALGYPKVGVMSRIVVLPVPARPGVSGGPRGQSAVMLAALRQRPQSALALNRLGVGRPNSRAADLRRRGLEVVCERVPGKSGAASFVYRLIGPLEDAASPATAEEVRCCPVTVAAASSSEPVETTLPHPGFPVRSSRVGVDSIGSNKDGGGWEPPVVQAVAPAGRESEPGVHAHQLSLAVTG